MVEAVTKRAGEPTEDYFARVLACPGAIDVKRADLADNTDPARLALLDEALRAKLEAKYERAFELLGIPPVHGSREVGRASLPPREAGDRSRRFAGEDPLPSRSRAAPS